MSRGILLIALLLVAAPLTGCISGDDGGGEPVQKQRADVSQGTGGLEGVVTDNAVQPIEGANVTLQELDKAVQAASDGSYAFSNVKPGSYTVTIGAGGFVSTQEQVTIREGEVTVLDVILTRAQVTEPFTQQIELAGFIECGVGWETDPNPQPGLTSNAVAMCAVPNSVLEFAGLGGNATNDKFSHTLELEPPIETMVHEIQIPGSGGPAGGTVLSLDMWIQGHVFAQDANIFDNVDARDGHLTRIDQPHFDKIRQNFTDRCQGLNDTEQDDTYCGYNFEDQGWPLIARAFADGRCFDAPASACAPIQQEFSHIISAFYHEPAPDGFSVLGGNQQAAQ